MTEKFIGYFRFLDACDAGGCPVCRCVGDDGRAHLASILHEHVTDPDTRRVVREAWGFCNWHTWMLTEIGGSAFGSAIVYEDLIERLVERARRPADRSRDRGRWTGWLGRRRRPPRLVELYRRRRACPVCVSAAATTDRYLRTIVRLADDPDIRAAYARSDGLCAPHLLRSLDIAAGDGGVRDLLERTVARWAKVREDVERFVEKHDHRNRTPVTDAEALSCRRAFEVMAGARGLFGSDVGVALDPVARHRAGRGRDHHDPERS